MQPSTKNQLDFLQRTARQLVEPYQSIYKIAIQNDYPENSCLDLTESFSNCISQIFTLCKHIAFEASPDADFDIWERGTDEAKQLNKKEIELEGVIEKFVESEK